MILTNTNIWNTRIQSVGFLVTAKWKDNIDVYYAAIICQLSSEEQYIGVSINPEFPISKIIAESNYLGINQLSDKQQELVWKCTNSKDDTRSLFDQLQLKYELSPNGVPLLLDCMQSLECEVFQKYDGDADHTLYICKLISRHIRESRCKEDSQLYLTPRSLSKSAQIKRLLYKTPMFAGFTKLKQKVYPPMSVEEGTRIWCNIEKEKIGLCLIGCGWWGKVHASAMKDLGDKINRFYVSQNPENSALFAKRFHGSAFASIEQALKSDEVDAVIICLPHQLHAKTAALALQAGKHVLVEKPIMLDVDSSAHLLQLADTKGLTFDVAEQYHCSPLIQFIKQSLQDKTLGKVHAIRIASAGLFKPEQQWKLNEHEMGGGILMDLGIHYVSILRALFGKIHDCYAVQSRGGYSHLSGEDSVTLQLGFEDEIIADIFLSWSCYRDANQNQIEILTDTGSFLFSLGKDELTHVWPLPASHWSNKIQKILPWKLLKHIHNYLPKQGRKVRKFKAQSSLHQLLLEQFIQDIENKTKSAINAEQGVEDLKVILKAYENMKHIKTST